MKKMIAVLLAALMLLGATAALADMPDSYVMTGGWIADSQTYSGSWQQTYLQILNNHSSKIHQYQDRTLGFYNGMSNYVSVPCKPVALTDITSDGIPELLFLEVANEERGDLYIYSANGSSTRCALYVPGITRLGYDDVGLGFDIYLSSSNGGTLVLEYYEFEKPWTLQLTRTALNQYVLLNYLTPQYDYSGEGDDYFYRNGVSISWADYDATLQALQSSKTLNISSYYQSDYSFYGLTMDWESAVSMLKGYNTPTAVPPSAPSYSSGVYGLTIDKLSTRTGPGTQYSEGGTYSVKGQYIKVLSKAWDSRNGIWWVKCEIPYHGETRVLWTGWKRFDHSTISLDDLPEEYW